MNETHAEDVLAPTRDSGTRVAVDAGDYMGETPVWSMHENALYWINCEHPPRVRGWDPLSQHVRSWPLPERIGGLTLRRAGGPVVCLGSGVYSLDLESGDISLIAPSPYPPHVKLHESCVDRTGRLWIGAADTPIGSDNLFPGQGGVCRLEGDKLIGMAIGLTVPNSLAFSADGESMYFCDTLRRVIRRADIRPKDRALIGIEEFIRLEPGVTSDGATVDSQDGYWVANFGGSEIRRYFSNGVLDRVFSMPTSQPTKPVFGGEDLKKIYVTSTQIVAPDFPASGRNGAVVELDVDIPGLPENYFEG